MSKYKIELSRLVTDTVCATVEVEASNEEEAKEKALALAAEDKLEFEFAQCGDSGETQVEEVTCLDDEATP